MTSQPERFSPAIRDRLADSRTILLVSAVSAWEIVVKHGLGKVRLPDAPREYVATRLRETRTTPLAVSWEHAVRVGDLPAHHRDPFDRLLVAQAQVERVPVVTSDPVFALYDVEVVRL